MPQIDALQHRLQKSSSYLSTVGQSTNFWDVGFSKRQSVVSSDGLLIKEITGDSIVSTARQDMGFDAAGGAGAGNRNSFAYTAANGNLVYAQGTDGNGLTAAQASAVYPVGSFFQYTSGAEAGILCKVLTNDGAGNLTVERNINNDVLANGQTDFSRGVLDINSENNEARAVQEIELIWQPPLSIFKVQEAMPCMKAELVLNPQTSSQYQSNAIEFKFEVKDMYLYVNTVEGPRRDNITYLLDLDEVTCQADKISSDAFGQRSFDVSPSTYALTVAYQDARATSSSQNSQSLFKVYNDNRTERSEELKLNRLFVNYDGVNYPQPDASPEFDDTKDYTTQRYIETQLNSGAYFDSGGAETIQEYHDRGSYYYFATPKDGASRSTRVNVHQGFNTTGPDATSKNMRVLLFSHHKRVARVRVVDGRTVDVQTQDA